MKALKLSFCAATSAGALLVGSTVCFGQEAPPTHKTIPSFTAPATTLRIENRAAVNFKAFDRTELGRTNAQGKKQPIKPGEMVKLKNGKSVKVEDYLAATNALEKKLNALGYSLRKPEKLPLPKEQIDEQNKAKAQLDAASKSSSGTPVSLVIDGIPYDAQAVATDTSTKSGAQAATPTPDLAAPGQHQIQVSGGKNGDWHATVAGFGFYFKSALNLEGSVEVSNTPTSQTSVTGNQYSQSLSEFSATTSADAGAVLFGQNVDVLHADAQYSGSDKTGQVQLSAHLSVLGNTVWQDSTSAAIGYSDGKTWSEPFDTSVPAITIPCSICSIGVQAGIHGSVGMTVGYKLFTSRIDGFIKPYISSEAYFRAGAGIDLGVASADIGVQGSLTLLNDELEVICGAGIVYENGFHFKDNIKISNSIAALGGDVSAYASASFLFFSDSITIPIFSWSGYNYNGVFYTDSQDIKLPWH